MARSAAAGLAARLAMLTAAVASVTYGLISWHAVGFDVAGVALYNNHWRLHPVHFVALGLGLLGPSVWEIVVLGLRLGGSQSAEAAGPAAPASTQRPAAPPVAVPRSAPGAVTATPEPATQDPLPHFPAAPRPRTFVRPIKAADRPELLALTQASRTLHAPWIKAPLTAHTFKVYLRRTERDDHYGYAVCLRTSGEMVGVINLNNIVRGAMLTATVAYYAGERHVGRGYMREALDQVKAHAFETLRLHRLEANIQPANIASIALVRRCGFTREGLAPKFLFIDGAWRDHERWAAVDGRTGLR